MDTRIRRARRAAVAALAFATAAALLTVAPPAHAAATIDRISGADRYETGANVSRDAFPDPGAVDVAYLATGEGFADALSAGAAAYAARGPVVLTLPTTLSDEARAELRRLQPDRIVVVGGPSAVSEAVLDAVRADDRIGAGEVTRIGGGDRFETAANIVTDAFPDPTSTVFVATGEAFPDALSGVPAAARYDAPLLLTARDFLPDATRTALQSLAPDRLVILGGPSAVSDTVRAELATLADDVDRLAGDDRFRTGVAVSQDAFVGARTVYVATGFNFPDALAGGPAAGMSAGPMLLTEPGTLPDVVASELVRLNPRRVVILGGAMAVSDAVRDEIARVLTQGSALPSGATPDLAFATVDNRADAPTAGSQVINVGTFDGAFETLTNPGDDHRDIRPLMSPDGRRLVFTRFADDGSGDALYLIDVAVGAGSTRRLFDPDRQFEDRGGCLVVDLVWAPSGDQLAFLCEHGDDTGPPLTAHVVDMRGRTRPIALPGSADTLPTGLAYAPDGFRLAVVIFDRNEPDPALASRIVAVDPSAPGAGSQGMIATSPLDESGSANPVFTLHWSQDGTTLVGAWGSSWLQRRVLVVKVASEATALRMEADEREVLGLTDDGARALVLTHGSADTLQLVPTAGGGATTIADGAVLEHGHVWTASLDGRHVVFDDLDSDGGRADRGNVWVSELDGRPRRLFDVVDVINGSPSLNPGRSTSSAMDREWHER